MPSSIDTIPFLKISDINFTAPKSVLLTSKRGAHFNNDRAMISDPAAIECPCSSIQSSSNYASSSVLNPNIIDPTEDQKHHFFTRISKHNPSCLSLIPPFSDAHIPDTKLTPLLAASLSSSYNPQNEELTYRELINLCEDFKLELTLEQISEIEEATKAQSKCDAWFSFRAGRVTASRMKAVCCTDPAAPSISLIKQLCYPRSFCFSSVSTK